MARHTPGQPRMMDVPVRIPDNGLDHDTIVALLPAVQKFVDGWLAEHDTVESTEDEYPHLYGPAANDYVERVRRYLAAATAGRHPELHTVCPECGREPAAEHSAEPHRMVGRWVVICCEGYWVIDPSLVGLPRGQWEPIGGGYFDSPADVARALVGDADA